MEQNNNNSQKKNKVVILLLFIAVFAVIFGGVFAAINIYDRMNTQPPESTQSSSVASTANAGESKVKNPIDFKSLQSKNDEIYAWIKIDDTQVDYPIVQNSEDDSFYLKHKAEDKSWSASGAIYTELANNTNFNDPVTVIYGHNGYGDTMFTTLHYFENFEFFDKHPYFHIYTPERRLTYQVISAFKYDDRHIMNSFFFPDQAELKEFQQMIQNPASVVKNVRDDLDTKIDISSKIVILSTCITNQKNNRYLVCGVLTNDEKTY